MTISSAELRAILAALASGVFALAGVVVTSILGQRREHETEWRQMKVSSTTGNSRQHSRVFTQGARRLRPKNAR
jgi:hypothetical protein